MWFGRVVDRNWLMYYLDMDFFVKGKVERNR